MDNGWMLWLVYIEFHFLLNELGKAIKCEALQLDEAIVFEVWNNFVVYEQHQSLVFCMLRETSKKPQFIWVDRCISEYQNFTPQKLYLISSEIQ